MIDINTLNKAIVLTTKGKFEEAETLYKRLLETEPESGPLLATVGLFYVNIGNFSQASFYLKKAYQINKSLGVISALGFAEYEQKNYIEAIKFFEEALELGEDKEVLNKLVLAFFHTKQYQKAIEYSGQMFEKYPDDLNSNSNMVKALTYCGKLLEAEKLCVSYLKSHNDACSMWFHLGYLKELIYSDDKQALECYRIASELGNPQAFYNMAVSYQKLGEYNLAEENYKKMLEFYPDDNDTIVSLGMCYLKQKKFKEGYSLFYKRKTNSPKTLYKPFEEFNDEVVVIPDQGYGDCIQFARYLPFIKNKVKHLVVACRGALLSLMQNSYPEIEFIPYENINLEMQSIRITDLAYILDMDFENIPYKHGYLKSDKADIQSDKLKVGLCWEAGSAGIRTMINRTINIKTFEPLFELDNAQTFSLQVSDSLKGNEKYADKMINLAKDFKSFEDTAKAIMGLDLVITVDTAVAHLAGALGVKTFLMLPYATDWRWFDDNKSTPWYEGVEIFKQTDPISWETPLQEVLSRIEECCINQGEKNAK